MALLALLLLLAAAPPPSRSSPAGPPDVLMREIQARGAAAVFARVREDDAEWRALLRGVAGGTGAWLDVAARLKPEADLDASLELNVAVADALERNAAGVLAVLGGAFDADDVCSLNTIEDYALGEVYAQALAKVERRQRAVAAVADPRLAAPREECAAFLGELKTEVRRNRAEWFVR